jgi:hypothetical protein
MAGFVEINHNEFVNLNYINYIKIVELPYIRIEFYVSIGSYAPEWQDHISNFTNINHTPIAFSKPFDTVAEAKEWLLNKLMEGGR